MRDNVEIEDNIKCENSTLESFLNSFIIFKREKQDLSIKDSENINNIRLKKVKIALSLTSEDMFDILAAA